MAVEDTTALEEVSILWTDGEVEYNNFAQWVVDETG